MPRVSRIALNAATAAAVLATAAVILPAGPRAAEMAMTTPGLAMKVYTSDDGILSLGQAPFAGGKTLDLTVGIGSGAFRHPDDPADVVYTVSDRGPNFTCGDLKGLTGVDGKAFCKGVKGRIYPRPDYTPTIYGIKLNADGTFSVFDSIAIKDRHGRPVSGLLNPLSIASTEIPIDGKGNVLDQDPNAVDAEGLVKLTDGSFWIGEENAPSILHVGADGRILMRIVPAGSEQDFALADYPVAGGLPAILTRRNTNRGIESMAISPDERFLYFMLQNPLANPDSKAYAAAKNTRVFKMERATMHLVGEYVYTLDDPDTFRLDPSKKQNAPRISEVMAIGTDRLVVLERTEKTTKLYEVALGDATNILGGVWDQERTKPSLEQTGVDKAAITPLPKTLRLDSADYKDVPFKVEGLAVLGNGDLFMINDDDFGIAGQRTKVVVVRGTGITLSE